MPRWWHRLAKNGTPEEDRHVRDKLTQQLTIDERADLERMGDWLHMAQTREGRPQLPAHVSWIWGVLRHTWQRIAHRTEDRTPEEMRNARERLIRTLNGELHADEAELDALLTVLGLPHHDPKHPR